MSYQEMKRWYIVSGSRKTSIFWKVGLLFISCWLSLFETVVRNSGCSNIEEIPRSVLTISFYLCGLGLLMCIAGICGLLTGIKDFLFLFFIGIFFSGLLTSLWLKVA